MTDAAGELCLINERERGNATSPDKWKSFDAFITGYQKIRKLMPLMTGREHDTMLVINSLNHEISELIAQVSVLFLNGGRREATQIPLQKVCRKSGHNRPSSQRL